MRWFLAVLLVAGCAPPVEESPIPAYTVGGEALNRPETARDRAVAVMDELGRFCAAESDECESQPLRPARYPNVQVPEATRRFVTDNEQELRSLGFQLRWDPGSRRYEIERGNTTFRRGDLQSDPP
jgi:hypothetical protein